MGFFDNAIAQQDGGGMLGGLPASWQYQNPETLTPEQRQLMALVGTQNADKAGFNPPADAPGAFPAGGAAPITGANSPFGMLPQPMQAPAPAPIVNPDPMVNQASAAPALGTPGAPSPPISSDNSAPPAAAPPLVAPPVPTFGAGASPIFATAPGSTPGNPALPSAAPVVKPPVIAADDGEEDPPAANALASPLKVGNYQMPRIGPAAAFAGDRSALPANSQPTQGVGAPGTDAAPSIGDKLMAGYQNLHHGGGLIGSIVAAVTGKRNDPTGVALQQQSQISNQTARALINKGVSPEMAMAAVQPGNGEMLKGLLTQAFGMGTHTQETDKDGNVWDVNKQTGQRTIALAAKDDKFQHFTTKNPDGSDSVHVFNTKTGEEKGGPSPALLQSAVDPESTGPERMDQLMKTNPNYARKIQAMVNGDIPMPTAGQAARSPQAQRMIEDALAVSGTTSASDFATKASTRKDYASGIASRVTKSINTTIGHFATLDQAIDKLGNYSYVPGVSNYVHDKFSSNFDPAYQVAKSKFETNKEAAVKELDFALSGGHSSVTGSAEIRDKFNRADSPEALHAAVQEAMSLLEKRLQSHTKAFNEGTKSQRDGQDFLYPENRAVYNKLRGSEDSSTGGEVPGLDPTKPAPVAPAAPTGPLKVGQSTVINGVPIKKVKD